MEDRNSCWTGTKRWFRTDPLLRRFAVKESARVSPKLLPELIPEFLHIKLGYPVRQEPGLSLI
jgi:hypothetical protein